MDMKPYWTKNVMLRDYETLEPIGEGYDTISEARRAVERMMKENPDRIVIMVDDYDWPINSTVYGKAYDNGQTETRLINLHEGE